MQPLASLKALKTLNLQNNQLPGVQPLAGLTNLRELFLSNNKIADLRPLSGLKKLKTVYLWSNQIDNLEPLKNLTGLRELTLINNPMLDLPVVARLQSDLPRLAIHHNSTRTRIQFFNKTIAPIIVRWVNFQGKYETYNSALKPDTGYSQSTYVKHEWVLFTPAGRELGRTFATDQITLWEVTLKGLKPLPPRDDLPQGGRNENN